MTTRRVLVVDAFTREPLAGNPAGIVPDADGLTDDQMRAVAREVGASETAFILPSGSADRRVRFFTPTTEVALCGHAAVATHAALHADGTIEPGTHRLETNEGAIDVELEPDGRVWMTQSDPEIEQVDLPYDRIGEALGLPEAALVDVGEDLPLATASTGLAYLMVPVNFLEHLSGMDPNYGAIEALTADLDVTGLYAFTFDALEAASTLHARMFAPAAGIPEDPATGTASGACGAYLRRFGAFDSLPEEMIFEQGEFVDRPGRIHVRARAEIQVGGYATPVLDGTLAVPDIDEDDILVA